MTINVSDNNAVTSQVQQGGMQSVKEQRLKRCAFMQLRKTVVMEQNCSGSSLLYQTK